MGGYMVASVEMTVAVLFARKDSNYKSIPGCDVWDVERDARLWPGGCPVIAHPPCRAWGRLRQFARVSEGEKQLAIRAVEHVRHFGGCLEHPAYSTLWNVCNLPRPGEFYDEWGGWTLYLEQFHFGHKALKPTWLYICGVRPSDIPVIPRRQGRPAYCIRGSLPSVTKAEREHTPFELALWLYELAQRCSS